MLIPYEILKHRLHRVLGEAPAHRDLTELIHFSRVIIQSHLEHVRTSVYWLCQHQGISIVDLSFDCLGEAFRRTGGGKFALLESFAGSLKAGLDETPDIEVFLAYRALLTKIADQHLARLFAQVDPAGAKIFRNIREGVKRSRILGLDHDLRGLVVRPRNGDSRDDLGPFPSEELARLLFGKAGRDRSTSGLLHILHLVLTGQERFRRSVPLADIAMVFKRLFAQDLESEEESPVSPFEGLSASDVEDIRAEVEATLRQKVLVTYVMNGKVGVGEARAILDAFHDLLGDWVQSGKTTDGVLLYLQRYAKVDRDVYIRDYRPKMEYLLRIAREEFEARLMREM